MTVQLQFSDVLACLPFLQFIHRDIKPDNLLLDARVSLQWRYMGEQGGRGGVWGDLGVMGGDLGGGGGYGDAVLWRDAQPHNRPQLTS